MRSDRYLTKAKQYGVVYKKGASWADRLVVMRALPNGLDFARYGLSVSHRVGGAVVRNRLKRLFREILRATPLSGGWDIVFIVRPAAAKTSYNDLERSVENLLNRAGILGKRTPGEIPDPGEVSGS